MKHSRARRKRMRERTRNQHTAGSVEDRLRRLMIRQPDTTCWIWNATIRGQYGTTKIAGVQEYAHRAMYEALVGPIPYKYILHHSCGRKLCINPDHMWLMTQREHSRLHRKKRI